MQELGLSIPQLARVFSVERLRNYQLAASKRGISALNLYQWNTLLAESLYPLLQTIEITFRNALYLAISEQFQDPTWLQTNTVLSYEDSLWVKKQEITLRKAKQEISVGKLIAELKFGFWVALLDSRYELKLWRTKIIKRVFPNLPAAERMRYKLAQRFNKIRKLRNRVFHYEPIWYWQDLLLQHDQLIEAINWIEPNCLKLIVSDRFPKIYAAGAGNG